MAIQTLGTAANNSLDLALVWQSLATATADVRAINEAIIDDLNPIDGSANPILAQTSGCGGFVKEGLLYVPNRGVLTLFSGDVVALDIASGWPILLTAYGLSAGPWHLV